MLAMIFSKKFNNLQGKKTSTHLPVQDEYILILDKWNSKSTCPKQIEFWVAQESLNFVN